MKGKTIALTLLAAFVGGLAVMMAACSTTRPAEKQMQGTAPLQTGRWSPAEYAAMAEQGRPVFTANCLRCHTVDGLANVPGPDLSDYGSEDWSHLRTADYIRDAQRYYPGTNMPSFGEGVAKKGEALTDRQIDDVTAYVSSLRKRADYLPKDLEHQPVL